MRKLTWVLLPLCLAALGCSGNGGGTTGISGTSGGSSGGSTGGGFTYSEVIAGDGGSANDSLAAAMASDGRIGIAYYEDVDQQHKSIAYSELDATGALTRTVTLVPSVYNVSELSIAFDQQGNALIAYLGNDAAVVEPHEQNGDGGVFWQESDLALAKVTPAGQLTTEYVVHKGNEALAGNPVSDNALWEVVGLSPAIQILPSGKVLLAYRDVHDGQFTTFANADLETAIGTPGGSWQHVVAIAGRDEPDPNFANKGLGAGTSLASFDGVVGLLASGQTAIGDIYQGLYQATYVDGGWASKSELFAGDPVAANLGQGFAPTGGPALAADPTSGFGAAWTDQTGGVLYYSGSTDGVHWSNPSPVFGSGTGGWFPNLAFDPTFTPPQPAVIYFICSPESGKHLGECSTPQLRVSERIPRGGQSYDWSNLQIDPQGGAFPHLFFGAGGQMVAVYRSLQTGGILLARQATP